MRKRNPGGLRPSGAFLVFIYTVILLVLIHGYHDDDGKG